MGGIAGLCKPAEVEWCTQCIIWRCLSFDACPWVTPGDICSVAVRYRAWSSLSVNRVEAENASGGGGVVEQARVSCPFRPCAPSAFTTSRPLVLWSEADGTNSTFSNKAMESCSSCFCTLEA